MMAPPPVFAMVVSLFAFLRFAAAGSSGNDDASSSMDPSTYAYKLYMAPVETALPGRFVVVYRDDTVDEDWRGDLMTRFANGAGYPVDFGPSFTRAIVADAIEIGPDETGVAPADIMMETILLPLLREHNVKYIEQEQITRVASDQAYPANLGLDRIDQRVGLDDNYHYERTGDGVTAYILDTGIRASHDEFVHDGDDGEGDRVRCAFNVFEDDGEGCDDLHGHGTAVAAVVAGKRYGVAKDARLVSIKVFDARGESSTSDILRGIEYVTLIGIQKQRNEDDAGGMVANLSAASHSSRSINQAATAASKYFFFSVAAGNHEGEACDYSPAGAIGVLTVAASDPRTDERSPTSNYGKCVDLFAPGVDIQTAGNRDDRASVVRTGSSMASAHATGAGALFLSANPTATPQLIKQRMIVRSVPQALDDTKDSPNLLLNLQSLFEIDAVLPPPRSDGGGRTPGQKFGIAVGWITFIAVVLVVPYVVYRRKYRNKRLHTQYINNYVD